MADQVAMGVSASSSVSPRSVCSILDRARRSECAQELCVVVSICVVFLSTQSADPSPSNCARGVVSARQSRAGTSVCV